MWSDPAVEAECRQPAPPRCQTIPGFSDWLKKLRRRHRRHHRRRHERERVRPGGQPDQEGGGGRRQGRSAEAGLPRVQQLLRDGGVQGHLRMGGRREGSLTAHHAAPRRTHADGCGEGCRDTSWGVDPRPKRIKRPPETPKVMVSCLRPKKRPPGWGTSMNESSIGSPSGGPTGALSTTA